MCNIVICYSSDLTESVAVMLEEGAVVEPDSLVQAALSGNPSIVRACATSPGVMIDAQESAGWLC